MNMKTFVVVLFLFILSGILAVSSILNINYVKETPMLNSELPVQLLQTSAESSNPAKLKAMLKGSIYETGEQMTVFGACFDGYNYLIEDAALNATLSSWYPNGTIWEQDVQMIAVLNSSNGTTGRWRYQVNMSTTMGTYLTEITCRYQGDIAQAYGEWQNPDWVKRIKDTQDSLVNFENVSSQYYNNLTNQISNFSSNVQNNFSQVLLQLNNLTVSGVSNNQLTVDIYNAIRAIDPVYWAPFIGWPGVGISGYAVDAISKNDIYVGDFNSNIVYYWDGETWSNITVSGAASIRDVSVVAANSTFAYIATNAGYSLNGDVLQTIPGASSNSLVEIKAFQRNPGEEIIIYALNFGGELWFSSNNGTNWANVHNFSFGGIGYSSISDILWYDGDNENNYRVLIGSANDDYVLYYNGTGYQQIYVN